MFKWIFRPQAKRFLAKHQVGQTFFTNSKGGGMLSLLRKYGCISSERVAPTYWSHKILKKQLA